jgi:hypothetical protein
MIVYVHEPAHDYLQPTDEFSNAVDAIVAVEEAGWSHGRRRVTRAVRVRRSRIDWSGRSRT